MPIIYFSLDELWEIQDFVRQHDRLRQVHDREDMRKAHRGILALQGLPIFQQVDATYPLDCSEGFLWAVEAQISKNLQYGPNKPTMGQKILLKVFAALAELEGEEDGPPTIFDKEFRDALARADADADPGPIG